MGHAPSLEEKVKESQAVADAVQKAVEAAEKTLANTEEKGVQYLTANTAGLVEREDSNLLSFSKFSEEFSLGALDTVVDAAISTAQDAIVLAATDGEDPDALKSAATDIGTLIKSVLALAASSSTTQTELQVSFSHILAGDTNFAVYHAYNSAMVEASNAWGNKAIKVVTNTYLLYTVKPDPAVTQAKIYQDQLDTLFKLEKQFDDAIVAASDEETYAKLGFYQKKIEDMKKRIQDDLNALT